MAKILSKEFHKTVSDQAIFQNHGISNGIGHGKLVWADAFDELADPPDMIEKLWQRQPPPFDNGDVLVWRRRPPDASDEHLVWRRRPPDAIDDDLVWRRRPPEHTPEQAIE